MDSLAATAQHGPVQASALSHPQVDRPRAVGSPESMLALQVHSVDVWQGGEAPAQVRSVTYDAFRGYAIALSAHRLCGCQAG